MPAFRASASVALRGDGFAVLGRVLGGEVCVGFAVYDALLGRDLVSSAVV